MNSTIAIVHRDITNQKRSIYMRRDGLKWGNNYQNNVTDSTIARIERLATDKRTYRSSVVQHSYICNEYTFDKEGPGLFDDLAEFASDIVKQKANARLIAAAPELLEACQYVVDWHREHDSGEGELFGLDFVTTCIAAISKTKG